MGWSARVRPPLHGHQGQAHGPGVHGRATKSGLFRKDRHDSTGATFPGGLAALLHEIRRAAQARRPCARSARQPRRWNPGPRCILCRGLVPVLGRSPASMSISAGARAVTDLRPGADSRGPHPVRKSTASQHLQRSCPPHVAQHLVHVREQGRCRARPAPFATATMDSASSRASSRIRAMNAPAAELDVHDQAVQPGRQFLAQNGGGDQVDGLHRGRDVADRVQPPVRRGQVRGLADDGAARLAHHAGKGFEGRARCRSRGWRRTCPACRPCAPDRARRSWARSAPHAAASGPRMSD